MATRILTGEQARAALSRGAEQTAAPISATFGPKGRGVVLMEGASPLVTSEAARAAAALGAGDDAQALGAHLVLQISARMAETAGDGGTAALILAQGIVREGLRAIAAGACPMAMRRGIVQAAACAARELRRQARPVTDMEQLTRVASAGAGSEELGRLAASAMEQIPGDGYVTIEPASTAHSRVEVRRGYSFDTGYLSSAMLRPDERVQMAVEDAYVLAAESVTSAAALVPLLQRLSAIHARLILVAANVSDEVLTMLTVNRLQGRADVVCVKAPGVGEQRLELLGDLAAFTGGRLFADNGVFQLHKAALDDLGRAKRVELTHASTAVLDGAGDPAVVASRMSAIRLELACAQEPLRRQQLSERLSKLSGGVATIYLGASTQTELTERQERLEHALRAARSAAEEGVVAGGGAAYAHAIGAVQQLCQSLSGDERTGARTVSRALELPIRQLSQNAGVDGSVVLGRVRESEDPAFGYDAAAQTYGDLFERGILDSAKTARLALEHASSAASSLLTAEAAVVQTPQRPRAGKAAAKPHFSIYD